MILIGNILSGLIAFGIIFLGSRFWWGPARASAEFGIADSPPPSTGLTAWLSVKGTRDIASGLFVILLMAHGASRLLGEFLLIASIIAFGDMATVLRSGGRRSVAFGVHGAVGLLIVATGACLIAGTC